MKRAVRHTFGWDRTREVLDELATVFALRPDGRGGIVAGPAGAPDVRVAPPAVLPPVGDDLAAWVAALPDRLGLELMVLLRAGSAALGLWRDDELVLHKVFKRYVVRGHGKAQPAHLKTKGKSRYGSRLRLQQHRRLLEEVNERITAWEHAEGPFDAIHRACPKRLWADLCATEPPPPFDARDPRIRRIALHAHEPGFDELLRIRRALRSGRVERAPAS